MKKKVTGFKLQVTKYFDSVIDVLRYFSFFDYPPTFAEIHTFLKKNTGKGRLARILEKMKEESLIKSNSKFKIQSSKKNSNNNDLATNYKLQTTYYNNPTRYTLGEYSIDEVQSSKFKVQSYNRYNNYDIYNSYQQKHSISLQKIQKILPYIQLLSLVPSIKLIGLSGSVAMLNAEKDHDIDLFIITAKNRLFTGRFLALLLAQVLGVRRHRQPIPGSSSKSNYQLLTTNYSPRDKVCLNLLFSETDLTIPKFKRTEYVAHEVLQMKPLVQKEDTYLSFLDANRWVFDIFPNAKLKIKNQKSKRQIKNQNFLFDRIEFLLKKLQLFFIKKHQTTEIVTDTQLWFHPDDFESKILGRG